MGNTNKKHLYELTSIELKDKIIQAAELADKSIYIFLDELIYKRAMDKNFIHTQYIHSLYGKYKRENTILSAVLSSESDNKLDMFINLLIKYNLNLTNDLIFYADDVDTMRILLDNGMYLNYTNHNICFGTTLDYNIDNNLTQFLIENDAQTKNDLIKNGCKIKRRLLQHIYTDECDKESYIKCVENRKNTDGLIMSHIKCVYGSGSKIKYVSV